MHTCKTQMGSQSKRNTQKPESRKSEGQLSSTPPYPHTSTDFSSNQHLNHAHDAVVDQVTAIVHVVELQLRRVILHVDGKEE